MSSLARTAFRLAAIEAMNADPTIAMLCPRRIFDSRIGELGSAEPVPVIVVLTEDAGGKAWSANNGGPPFDDICQLSIEISIRVLAEAPDGEEGVLLVETDREAEARLDLLEHRAVEAITVADTPQSRLVRQKVTRRVTSYSSVRFASDETGIKLAVRIVNLTVELKGDDRHDATVVLTGPYAALPEPLRSVAIAMPAGSSAKATCDQLAALIAAVPTVPFGGMDITIAPGLAVGAGTAPAPPGPGENGPTYGNFGATAEPATL
jgi:hypothetical protein